MAFKRSRNLANLEASKTVAIKEQAQRRRAAGEDIVDLSVGEPDFDTPRIPAEAGIKAIQQGKTHYPPNAGILELRAAAAHHLSLLSGGRPINADHVVVSTGARQSLFNACFSLFEGGDTVLIPAPAWVSYPQLVHLARAQPVLVPGDAEWSLKVGVGELENAADARAAGLILCTPVNPTGAVYTRAELKALLEWARERRLWVIADEMYRRIHFGSGPAPSVYDLPDELLERVVVVTGVGKAYAMTGWRVGIAVAPPLVAQAMAAMQTHVTSGASQPAQWAAAAALADERRPSGSVATWWWRTFEESFPGWSSWTPSGRSTSSSESTGSSMGSSRAPRRSASVSWRSRGSRWCRAKRSGTGGGCGSPLLPQKRHCARH
jgi:aspartate aminotransferase